MPSAGTPSAKGPARPTVFSRQGPLSTHPPLRPPQSRYGPGIALLLLGQLLLIGFLFADRRRRQRAEENLKAINKVLEQRVIEHHEEPSMKEKITVLIVEDDPNDYFLLAESLRSPEEVDIDILHEHRLDGALAAGDSGKIDTAIIDLSLPDSFGIDTFLAFHQRHPSIPTIIMTGTQDQEMAFAAVRQGAQDYLFKGELSATALIRSLRYAIERQRLMTELQKALDHVRQLQGMLPICAICKNIRDDKGYWNSIESYISAHSEVKFSHSICPVCAKKHYQEFLGPAASEG